MIECPLTREESEALTALCQSMGIPEAQAFHEGMRAWLSAYRMELVRCISIPPLHKVTPERPETAASIRISAYHGLLDWRVSYGLPSAVVKATTAECGAKRSSVRSQTVYGLPYTVDFLRLMIA